ncbi:hypothetical protein CVT24_011734 [Panaeolus cyanescens]|uniref:Uncharacterized protein n=1 Tax=Panaeolus cyanescens TaxID=181874 RepID=A0A409YNH9_9AGAR|nr:hypothetical protein CVT24_011734 [Panaeolus cyanescens]
MTQNSYSFVVQTFDDTDTPEGDILVSSLCYGNPFFAPMKERDLFSVPKGPNEIGFVIPVLSRDALWWNIDRYYEVIAKIALAVTIPNVSDPLSLPLPAHDAIPDRLFDALVLPRPRILTVYRPGMECPLAGFFRTGSDAIVAWDRYREIGQAAIGFLLTVHERISLILDEHRRTLEIEDVQFDINDFFEMPGLEPIHGALESNTTVSPTPPPTPSFDNDQPLPIVPIEVSVYSTESSTISEGYSSDEPTEADYGLVVSDDEEVVRGLSEMGLIDTYSRLAVQLWTNLGIEM